MSALTGSVIHALRMLGGLDIKIDHDPFVVAADDNEIKRLIGGVQLLMRHIGREIDVVAGIYVGHELEPRAPAYLSAPADDVDGNLVAPVVMRSGPGAGRERNRPDPRSTAAGAGKVEGGRASGRRRAEHSATHRLAAHNLYASGSPLYCFGHDRLRRQLLRESG